MLKTEKSMVVDEIIAYVNGGLLQQNLPALRIDKKCDTNISEKETVMECLATIPFEGYMDKRLGIQDALMWQLDERGMQTDITKVTCVSDVHSFISTHVLTSEVLAAYKEAVRQKYEEEARVDTVIKNIVTEGEINAWVGRLMDAGVAQLGANKMMGLRHRFGTLMEIMMWVAVAKHPFES